MALSYLQLNHYANLSSHDHPVLISFSILSPRSTEDKISADQTPASSWWNSHISDSLPAAKNYFQATHGLVQTHPSFGKTGPSALPLSSGPRPSSSSPLLASGFPSIANPNPRSPFRHLDFSTSATAELRRNPSLSAPDECARACREGEPPRICYYHFTVEYYTVLGA